MVDSDLSDFESKKYLLLVDYYSKYIAVVELTTVTTISVINAMKTVFAYHGIPQTLRSVNGPQYSSAEFKTICKEYGIDHETSSPTFKAVMAKQSARFKPRNVYGVKHLTNI